MFCSLWPTAEDYGCTSHKCMCCNTVLQVWEYVVVSQVKSSLINVRRQLPITANPIARVYCIWAPSVSVPLILNVSLGLLRSNSLFLSCHNRFKHKNHLVRISKTFWSTRSGMEMSTVLFKKHPVLKKNYLLETRTAISCLPAYFAVIIIHCPNQLPMWQMDNKADVPHLVLMSTLDVFVVFQKRWMQTLYPGVWAVSEDEVCRPV